MPNVGHRAVKLVSRLVDLLDEHGIARQYLRTLATDELREVEREARRIKALADAGSSRGSADRNFEPRSGFAWCEECGSYHLEDDEPREARGARA